MRSAGPRIWRGAVFGSAAPEAPPPPQPASVSIMAHIRIAQAMRIFGNYIVYALTH
jgi:hypothetical protein